MLEKTVQGVPAQCCVAVGGALEHRSCFLSAGILAVLQQ